jgi:hypothetical protein|tara:strand:- start:1274 stop:1504 length:231 start_codon:yes stop_codon:yes gene_type:complete
MATLKQRHTTNVWPKLRHTIALWLLVILVVSCTPTVQVAPPTEPITINLNIKIEHEIKIKVDKELDDLFESESDLF